jgi:phosphatidylserine decarboxylase
MATVWHGTIDRPRTRRVRDWPYAADQVVLKRGEEMGRFMLGSTVVMLFARDADLAFNPLWEPGRAIRLGEAMASVAPRSAART